VAVEDLFPASVEPEVVVPPVVVEAARMPPVAVEVTAGLRVQLHK
jgi:hypothetical protein